MLHQLGAEDIDQAANAREALKKCTEKNYHIILCDYNLGPEQDGQQILEELHERFLMLSGTLFLMVTAETGAAKVISAIEYQPDAYLTKPFTRDQLAQRLKRLMVKNAALSEIYKAINNHQPRKAIELCSSVKEKYPKVKYACLRIQSEILEQQNEFDETLAIFDAVVEEQPLLWAFIGQGRICFKQNKFKQALAHFEKMKTDHPNQVSVLDWIAKCQKALGATQQAETVIQEALKISPKSVRRQSDLGEVAESLEHHDIAHKAYGKAINEGSYSCLLQAEHFQHYFDNTKQLVKQRQGREQIRLLENTETVFKKMEKKLQKEPASMAANLSAISTIFSTVGQNEKTAKYLSRLKRVLEKPDCELSAENSKLIEHNLDQLEPSKATEKHLKQLSARINIKKKEQQKIVKSDVLPKNDVIAQQANSEGIKLTKQQRPLEALQKFKEAIKLIPNKNSYLLNAAQVIIESEMLLSDANLKLEAENFIREVNLDPADLRWERFKMLSDRFNHD